MPASPVSQDPIPPEIVTLSPGRVIGFAVSVALLLLIWQNAPQSLAQLASLSAAVVLSIFLVRDVIVWARSAKVQNSYVNTLKLLLNDDIVPAVISDKSGAVLWANAASDTLMTRADHAVLTVGQMLADQIESSEQVLRRVHIAAAQTGRACETVIGIDTVIRLHLQHFGGLQLWRIEQKGSPKEALETGVPSILLGRNGVVLSMNDAARALVGARAKSTATLFRDDAIPEDGPASLMTSSGEVLVQVRSRKTGAGRVRLVLTPVEAEAALSKTSLEDLPLPALRIAPQGKILEANELAAQLLNVDDLPSKGLAAVLEGLEAPVDVTVEKAVLDGLVHGPQVLRVRNMDGETFVQMTLKRVMHRASVTLVAILSDATELKSLEAQFVQGQKMQAIGQLAGGVAHDFNNLLTAISGHCDLMLLRHDQGDQDYADLIQIHQNANRAAALVTQLLAFSRKQTLKPEFLDLRDTLSDLTHLLNRLVGEKVSLVLSHDPVLRPIRADRRQLEQVIMNLVVNARDAMSEGGQILIETESLTLREPLNRDRVTVPEGDYVVVRVRDQGSGIHPDVMQKIFEPFFSTKRIGEGTGLGLSTAYGIVKQTGGYIFVDSQLGQGTCFSLMFVAQTPQARPVAEAEAEPIRASAEPCEGVVLLVEDEAPVRAFASRALSMRGFEVLEAASGEEALTLLEDDQIDVDVFVTDVVMPGEDGPTWVRKALEKRPNVRVVFVSGYAEGAFGGDAPTVPGSVFLPKPFSLSELTATVQTQVS